MREADGGESGIDPGTQRSHQSSKGSYKDVLCALIVVSDIIIILHPSVE
jgi:hypothetical protein